MTQMGTLTKSPLGDLSTHYLEKSSKRGSIQDHPEKEMLELYPAGYTKASSTGNRQHTYRQLFEIAIILKTEDKDFPFGHESHQITLEHEPNNDHDPNAIRIIIRVEDEDSPLLKLDGCNLGFVPKQISKQVRENLDSFNSGRILRVRSKVFKKYFGAKIMFP